MDNLVKSFRDPLLDRHLAEKFGSKSSKRWKRTVVGAHTHSSALRTTGTVLNEPGDITTSGERI